MSSPFPLSLRTGFLCGILLAALTHRASAQVTLHPELLVSYAAWSAPREAAPGDPSLEPVVALSSLVLSLAEGLGSGEVKLEPQVALAVELQLASLIDSPVLPRADAARRVGELADALGSRHLIALLATSRKMNFDARPDLLGADAATANPFYNPDSLPGYAARFVLAHIRDVLRPAAGPTTN